MFAIKTLKNLGYRIYPIFLFCAVMQPAVAIESVKIESKAVNSHYSAILDAYLDKPVGTGPFPAVVLMHGCAGLSEAARRGMDNHTEYLVSRGFVTLVVDSFGARAKDGGSICASQSDLAAARHYRHIDAYHALEFLQTQPFVDNNNIFLMGQSNGGSVALAASLGPVPSLFPGELRFQGIVAYYPWCGALPTWPNKIVSPLLVLGAGEDDWVDPEYCVSAREQVSGADYDVVVYDKALHSFDLPIDEQIYAGHRVGGDSEATKDSQEKMVEWFLAHRQQAENGRSPVMKMTEFIMQNEPAVRLGFFTGIFVLMALWELTSPRRKLAVSKMPRWGNNLGLVIINSVILRILFPAGAIGVAAFATSNGWGLLNYCELPLAMAIPLSVVVMDFIIYLQHVLVHAIPVLWRLHRVHHADLDYDLTTGTRFHTLEIIVSMLIKFATIIALGPPVVAVVIFEVVLNGMSMFNHANVKLPLAVDRVLRLLVVTPDMHRVHHSVEENEANSNYGFNLAIWDRLFGTYIDQPRAGHEGMTIGIHQLRDPKQVNRLPGMLLLPFVGKISGYAINRREWSKPEDK